jgi:deoxycytidine triphosphate deaminase
MEADMLLTHLQLEQLNIIHGASPRQKHSGILSYGYSFCGYDLRLDSKFYRFTCCSINGHNDAKKPLIVDVKQFAENPDLLKEHFVLCEESYRIVLNGHESILACTNGRGAHAKALRGHCAWQEHLCSMRAACQFDTD